METSQPTRELQRVERSGRAEAPLLRPDPGLQATLDGAAAGIGCLDDGLRLTCCNRALAEFCAGRVEEMQGQDICKFLPEVARLRDELRAAQSSNGAKVAQGSAALRLDGAGQRFVDLTLRAAASQGFVLTVVDTTTHVQARQCIEAAYERLQTTAAANQERLQREQALVLSGRDRFLASLGHELRNPLTPILTWTQLLKHEPSLTLRLAHAIAVIERNALHQKSLVDDLLDLASLHSGEMKFERASLCIEAVLGDVVKAFEEKARDNNVTLKFESLAPGAGVMGDEARLAQVFRNLIDNAIKFTPPGGNVSVRLSNLARAVQVEVADTGIGIPQDFMRELFELFSQAHDLHSPHRRGLGVGLALVRHLVERHGGRVEASSQGEHKGATFTVSLPLLNGQSGPPKTNGNGKHRHKVLVIEDNDDTREVLCTLLESWSLDVSGAEDGEAGLKLLATLRPDLILCDLTMPVMDGWCVAQEIRTRHRLLDVPLIALSGHGTPRDITRSKECGFQDHLVKPFDANDLYRMIGKYLPLTAKAPPREQ